MANPNNQSDCDKKDKPKTNFKLIFERLKQEWKAYPFKIIIGKYSLLFYGMQ